MNDERLAQRAAAGDRAAFEAIFRRYHQDLYRYCLATVGNSQDAQDALQNTMVKAMQALPGEQREIKLKPWLYRVARNEAIETLRKRRDGVELDAEQEAADWDVTESTAMRERLRQLFADLEELPERQRSALVMRELAGLDFGEIGAAFGTSPEAVRQTLYEARLSLRQMDEGREMDCEGVMRALSDADGRVTRRRDVRAHLRSCASCRAFRDDIAERRNEFTVIAPLPAALSAGLLQALIGGQASTLGAASAAPAAGAASSGGTAASSGGRAGTVGAGVGKTIAAATIAKSAATVAVVAAVGVSAADRSGVVDLPLGGGDGKEAKRSPEPRSPAATEAVANPGAAASPQAPSKRSNTNSDSDPVSAAPGKQADKPAPSPGPSTAPGKSQAGPARGRPQGNSKRSKTQGNSERGKPQAHGKPAKATPPAASPGQETAAEHKAPQAGSPPGRGGNAAAPPKPPQSPKSEGASAAPPPPEATTPEAPQSTKGKPGP
ncbi:MAG TPA: sigma-70 family RNA polymerase sigma factor [Solirubrobacterales bacterium]|nr:sigma-70 family RNA polymerase sigma factor [Solirubrobacterales bacterium]